MDGYVRIGTVLGLALVLIFSMVAGSSIAETLNPGEVNPHAESPRKRITLEQKRAAAAARKQKAAEIAARKAAQKNAGKSLEPFKQGEGNNSR